jgi:excisionase family DNA binding protein
MDTQRDPVSPEEAGALTGYKPVTIRAWCNQRKIGFYRINRAIRIPRSEVDRLLQESFVPAISNERGR